MKSTVVNKEVALEDLEKFVNRFVKKPVQKDQLEKTYPDILDAITDGFLSFDADGAAKYKLKDPIKNDANEVSLSEISFRTRIKPTTLADLAKGLHPQNEVYTLQLRMTSYIIDQPVIMLDKFGRYDYDAISSIASVFS